MNGAGGPGYGRPPLSMHHVKDVLGYLGEFASDALAEAEAVAGYGGLSDGMWYWNTMDNEYRIFNGTVWLVYDVRMVDFPIFEWMLFNGAVAGTLNTGKITTTKLPKQTEKPGIQFKVDLRDMIDDVDMVIELVGSHSTITQTLNINLDNTIINPGENFNTKAAEATLNIPPVTPGAAFQRFTAQFIVPAVALEVCGSFEGQLWRENAGADTGDLHIWQLRAYQVIT